MQTFLRRLAILLAAMSATTLSTAVRLPAQPASRNSAESATFAVVVGAVISHWYDGRIRSAPHPERAERLGTLVASGLIVGESLWGVINAGLIVALSNEAPIALVPADFALAPWLGVIGFVGSIVLLYGWMLRRSAATSN